MAVAGPSGLPSRADPAQEHDAAAKHQHGERQEYKLFHSTPDCARLGCYALSMLILLLWGCQVSGSTDTPAPTPALTDPAPTAPDPQVTMPPLSPSGPFLQWLSSQESTLLLPFEIEVNPLGIQSATLMAEPPVAFSLDTGAMGITLESRLQDPCPGESLCRVWLKGRYGPLVGAGLAPSGHSFTVYQVIEAVDGTPRQARRE